MKKQGGFTLIELVVVIVILGILAVTAAPRFLNLQGDARAASLQGLNGAIAGALGIVYGGSAINGEETVEKTTSSSTTPQTNGVATSFGYPTAETIGTLDRGIEMAVTGLPGTDWIEVGVKVHGLGGDHVAYSFKGTDTNANTNGFVYNAVTPNLNTGCFVIYVEAADEDTSGYSEAITDAC